MNKKFILILALMISACSTSYKGEGLMGGYSDIRIDENVFVVTFKGNTHTDDEKAVDYTLLRSAELALKNDFKYFVIVDRESYSKESSLMSLTTSSRKNTIVCYKEKPLNTFSYNAEFVYRELSEKYSVGFDR